MRGRIVIGRTCMGCGTTLPQQRDFDNHACVPPKCCCWKPGLSDHEAGCPVLALEDVQDRTIRAVLVRGGSGC